MRDQGKCVDCPANWPAWEWHEWQADHVVELADGGTDDLDNAVTRCVKHHRAKTAAARRARSRGRVLTAQPTLFPELVLPLTVRRRARR